MENKYIARLYKNHFFKQLYWYVGFDKDILMTKDEILSKLIKENDDIDKFYRIINSQYDFLYNLLNRINETKNNIKYLDSWCKFYENKNPKKYTMYKREKLKTEKGLKRAYKVLHRIN